MAIPEPNQAVLLLHRKPDTPHKEFEIAHRNQFALKAPIFKDCPRTAVSMLQASGHNPLKKSLMRALGIRIPNNVDSLLASCDVVVVIEFNGATELEKFMDSEKKKEKLDLDRPDFWVSFLN